MTMQAYETAVELMTSCPKAMVFVGPRSTQLVEEAEKALRLEFPSTYKRFLLEYGAGSFAGEEIYGLIGSDFKQSSTPNAIWSTLLLRAEVQLPHNYIHIYSVGDGEIHCLSVNSATAPVVPFEPGLEIAYQSQEIVAPDFGNFLLERVQEALAFLEDIGDI